MNCHNSNSMHVWIRVFADTNWHQPYNLFCECPESSVFCRQTMTAVLDIETVFVRCMSLRSFMKLHYHPGMYMNAMNFDRALTQSVLAGNVGLFRQQGTVVFIQNSRILTL